LTKKEFSVKIYPSFFVKLDKLDSPVLDRVQTITGVVSDPTLTNATIILNGEERVMELTADPVNKVARFSQKVSLKAEADKTNTIKVVAVNELGERAEDSMDLVVEVPAIWARAVLTWNTRADIDLWVTDPTGERIGYYHKVSANEGILDFDDVNGYGPETFTQNKGLSGSYTIRVHYFGDTSGAYEDAPPPTGWQVRLTLFEGTENEEIHTYSGILGSVGQWSTVATFTIPATSVSSSPFGEFCSKSYEAVIVPGGPGGYINPKDLPKK